jgi:hypothetical protein
MRPDAVSEPALLPLFLLLSLAAPLSSQIANDTCVTAIPVTGASIIGTNVGATTGPDPLPACSIPTGDVWYSWVAPCSGTYTASTCAVITNFPTIVAIWHGIAGCGSLIQVTCSDVCAAGAFSGASTAFLANAGAVYFVSVAGNFGASGTFELTLALGASMTLSFFDGGPGSLGYLVNEGPGSGTSFVAMTQNAGVFPLGWFLGIDIGWLELMSQLSVGFPFVTVLQPCGLAIVGPVFGLPSGLTVYAVGIALPQGGSIPTATTLPVVGVVP